MAFPAHSRMLQRMASRFGGAACRAAPVCPRPAGVAAAAGLSRPRGFAAAATRPRLSPAPALEEKYDVPAPAPLAKKMPAPVAPQLRDLKLGFIGWGAMAQAVSLGIIRQDLTDASRVMASDLVPEIRAAADREGLQVTKSVTELVEWADVVVMAVKPQVVDKVLAEIAPSWKKDKLMVSICAGTTIGAYSEGLGADAKVVRVMPNSPCLVGQAATAYAGSTTCGDGELDLVHDMFAAVGGATHRVPEHLMNAVTGLSGSGPAFVYMMIQALSDAGVRGGLPRAVAQSLAAQTVAGAARTVQQSGQHPAVLKEAVTSPAGTTIEGVSVLEELGFNSAIMQAVEAARTRSEELSKTAD